MTFRNHTTTLLALATLNACAMAPAHADAWHPDAAVAGAIGGLLGAVYVQGRAFGKIAIDFDGNLAFEGILIAIVARSRPLAVPFVALAYGYLRQGAQLMGIRTDVPVEMIAVVQALVILLVASQFTLPGRRWFDRLLGRKEAAA
jgi:simple sugar transport system permease protein